MSVGLRTEGRGSFTRPFRRPPSRRLFNFIRLENVKNLKRNARCWSYVSLGHALAGEAMLGIKFQSAAAQSTNLSMIPVITFFADKWPHFTPSGVVLSGAPAFGGHLLLLTCKDRTTVWSNRINLLYADKQLLFLAMVPPFITKLLWPVILPQRLVFGFEVGESS